jgi:hypothetical protein
MIILNISSNTKLIYVKFYIEIASDFVKKIKKGIKGIK